MSTILSIIERETGQAVTEETTLETLALDSLELIELLQAIENGTGAVVPDSAFGDLQTVGDILRLAAE